MIHLLCDVVAKNDNLLLSIRLRGDGTVDANERRILDDLGDSMGRNGEAIHGTQPWRSSAKALRARSASPHAPRLTTRLLAVRTEP